MEEFLINLQFKSISAHDGRNKTYKQDNDCKESNKDQTEKDQQSRTGKIYTTSLISLHPTILS